MAIRKIIAVLLEQELLSRSITSLTPSDCTAIAESLIGKLAELEFALSTAEDADDHRHDH